MRVRSKLLLTGWIVTALAACTDASAPGVQLRIAPVPAAACMDALIGGTLARNAQSGLGIISADGRATAIEWPFGYGAWIELGRVVLGDETGKTVAREGDEITVGGGFGKQFWFACGPVTVTKAVR